ncbi:hypothetical protein EJ05DRAFT_388576 [Pseudovirgaria hyperparasitica]|uniref:F-box domain-containing protein n=1 Tax=Pseudovirgaria hyperparasitica TaxID=470096 RepID=A0A6A6W378_9PEZI|nr:uncharacterized protein EJ05DRAFT_388576 [Pseudovirgaria hyperparasitica]KAF2757398.1 hypothetical protein EJ05DRAFT_388576 [Pseudovirgaria hyperparasitica]
MSRSGFGRLPIELSAYIAELLDTTDLSSFRFTCRQADVQTFDVFARRCLTQWRTTLMGSDFETLELTSRHRNLAKYVKTLILEDDANRSEETDVWPRDEAGMVLCNTIGVPALKCMLQDGRLRPSEIHIKDCRLIHTVPGPYYCAAMTREVLENLDITVVSLTFEHAFHQTVVATIGLAQEHHIGSELEMLHSARLLLADGLDPYWPTRVLHRAPTLKQLGIRCGGNQQPRALISDYLIEKEPLPRLSELSIMDGRISLACFRPLIAPSIETLTRLELLGVELNVETSWSTLLEQTAGELNNLKGFWLSGLGILPYRVGERLRRTQRRIIFTFPKERISGHHCHKAFHKYSYRCSDPALLQSGLELAGPMFWPRGEVDEVKYSGPNARAFLTLVAKIAVEYMQSDET